MIQQNLKKLFTIKIKPRDDTVFDQYNRIFMVKVFLACCVVCGIDWYTDDLNCNVRPKRSSTFVGGACWVQGVYVYRELRTRNDDIAYFGITNDIDLDGIMIGTNDLCKTQPRLSAPNKNCRPLTKTFFLQYQYMPFVFGVMAAIYYIPYLAFKSANHDIMALQSKIKSNAEGVIIFRTFFKKRDQTRHHGKQLSSCHLSILLVKIVYVVVNVSVMFCLDGILEGYFIGFGGRWLEWSQQDSTLMFDYMGSREFPKPANEVLPPFGYCEVYLSAKDIRATEVDHVKVICEISPHMLYQYALILLWFCIVLGIIISSIGLIVALAKMICGYLGLRKLWEKEDLKWIYPCITYREMEYLKIIKEHSKQYHDEIVQLISRSRHHCMTLHDEQLLDGYSSSRDSKDDARDQSSSKLSLLPEVNLPVNEHSFIDPLDEQQPFHVSIAVKLEAPN